MSAVASRAETPSDQRTRSHYVVQFERSGVTGFVPEAINTSGGQVDIERDGGISRPVGVTIRVSGTAISEMIVGVKPARSIRARSSSSACRMARGYENDSRMNNIRVQDVM